MRRVPRIFAAFAALITAAAGMAAPQAATADEISSLLTIDKVASVAEVSPGEEFAYTITLGCSSITENGCFDATLTDLVPDEFEILNVEATGASHTDSPLFSGQDVTVSFNEDLGDGKLGMKDNSTVSVVVHVKAREDLPYSANGIPVDNNAKATASNAEPKQAKATVTPRIPLSLDTEAAKALDPTSAIAAEGTTVTATLTGKNTSNAPVDSLTIQDPTDPATSPNPFEYLGFNGFGTVVAPAGATTATYYVYVGEDWVEAPNGELPSGIAAADVKGTKVTFTGTIEQGATATVPLNLAHTALAAQQADGTVVNNTVTSSVTKGTNSATDDAAATHTLRENKIVPGAAKNFEPDLLTPGQTTTATLKGSNQSAAVVLDTLTIREPAAGTEFFSSDVAFAGFGPVDFPQGATAGTGTVWVGSTSYSVTLTDDSAPALPTGINASDVTGFEFTFTGSIPTGAQATVPFDVTASQSVTGLPKSLDNTIDVVGKNGEAEETTQATDILHLYDEQLEVWVDKQVRPDQILAVAGSTATVTLEGGTTDLPDPEAEDPNAGTTAYADQVVLQDPESLPAAAGSWWDTFDATSITLTPIPDHATLTVKYYDVTDASWKDLATDVAGPQIYSEAIDASLRDKIGGLQFVYDYTGSEDGFAPGTTFKPNFTSALRETSRSDANVAAFDAENGATVQNCAISNGTVSTADGGPDATADKVCDDIELIPVVPGPDLIDKQWLTGSSGGPKAVNSRSSDTIPARLYWSTGGYSFDSMTITDVASPETTSIADSVYDAFDLVRIEPITATLDPYMVYDAVTKVQLYYDGEWHETATDPCANDACLGAFPGYTLTTEEQEKTTGVRLVFAERADRASVADQIDEPQPGTGVARTFDNDRAIDLTFRVRDERRDPNNSDPVLEDYEYNLDGQDGTVRNTVNATGISGDLTRSDQDADDVSIVDVPLTVETTKKWTGGPLAIPESGTPAEDYPSGRVTITTKNTTPARVDSMVITDPEPGTALTDSGNPFNAFNLKDIAAITEPAGADASQTKVTLTFADDTAQTYSKTEALALNSAATSDAVGIQVSFGGRIKSAATGTVVLDLQLREKYRSNNAAVTVSESPIANQAKGEISDLKDKDPNRTASDRKSATIPLTTPDLGLNVTKTISPQTQENGDTSPVTVTLQAQPSGSARTAQMVVEDSDWTFFNAFNFTGIASSFNLASPINRVTIETLTGATFSSSGATGGSWSTMVTNGTAADALAWSNGLNVAERTDIQGLRFTFTRSDGAGWENTSRPMQVIPLQLERRSELRSGGAVPDTTPTNSAAPGESTPGEFGNDVTAQSTSVPIDGQGATLSAADKDAATYRYLALETSVSVTKSPTGVKSPGSVIPFTLTFTNTGETDIHEPVFTDYIPTDSTGNPMLILDPDRDMTVSPFTFAISGTSPSETGYTALPTDSEDIEITIADDQITFAMPEGTALGKGQTYTITVPMMFQPGISAGTEVTNTTSITATDPAQNFTQCAAYPGEPNEGDLVYECFADTTVEPTSQAALAGRKFVKADTPAHDPISEKDGYTCTEADADADGFYRSPCIPVSTPGTNVTWKYVLTNTGTLPLNEVRAIDHLPTPGDTGVVVNLPRGSQWKGTFAGGLHVTNLPQGATATYLYSTSDTPCTTDLDPTSSGCAAETWMTEPELTAAGLKWADVRSFQVQVSLPDGSYLQPGQTLSLEYKTHTPADMDSLSSYPVAWNTVAAGGSAIDGVKTVKVPTTEGRRVGVSYPVGSIEVVKEITGDGAAFAPDSFEAQVVCTVNDSQLGEVEVANMPTLTLTDGVPQRVDNIPAGASCTVTEAADYGQSTSQANTVTVAAARATQTAQIAQVTLTNQYDLGGFSVTKSVDNPAKDQDGNPVSLADTYVFSASCVFLGDEVLPAADRTFTLGAGDTLAFTGIPAGASCTVTETDASNATTTDMTITVGNNESTMVEGDTAEFTIRPGSDAMTAVNVTNTYEVGSLKVIKSIDGPGSSKLADGPFEVDVTCELPNAASNPVFSKTFQITTDSPVVVDDLPAGAECTVTETDDGGADATPAPVTVTIPGEADGTPQTVTTGLLNEFSAAEASITKVLDGSAASEPWATAAVFDVLATCQIQRGDELVTLHSASYQIRGGQSTPLVDGAGQPVQLPRGAHCFIEETNAGGATSSQVNYDSYENAAVVNVSDELQQLELTATNTFEYGAFDVTKTLSGAGAAKGEGVDFTAQATCTLDQGADEPTTVLDKEFTIRAGSPVAFDQVPVGATCAVTETESGKAIASTVEVGNQKGKTVTFQVSSAPVHVTINNEFAADLEKTGVDSTRLAIQLGAAGSALLVGAGLVLAARRRRVTLR